MDKRFIALALVAFVGVASAASVSQKEEEKSPLVVYQDNANEVAGLSPEMKELFGDYCLSSRDYIKSYKDFTDFSAIDDLFNLFPAKVLDSISEYGELVRTKDACKMIKANFKSKWDAVADVFNTIYMAARLQDSWFANPSDGFGLVHEKAQTIAGAMMKKGFLARARNTCTLVRQTLVPALKQQLSSFKENLSQGSKQKNIEEILNSTDFSNVGCALTNGIKILSDACWNLLAVKVEDLERLGLQ